MTVPGSGFKQVKSCSSLCSRVKLANMLLLDGRGLALEHKDIYEIRATCCLQEEGTYHFRTTFLIPEPETDEVAERLVKFHNSFLAKYGEPEQ